jgi:phenylacetate-coenzyme A ligase PaaK-like adenylate-forming protein
MADLGLVARQALASVRLARDVRRAARPWDGGRTAERRIRERLAARESNFLDLVDRTVWARPKSPYRRLLRWAGCEPGDLAGMVHQHGLEAALERLNEVGVFVTAEELKGRSPIIRGSVRMHVTASDFDNPLIRPHFVVPTSGSTGRPVHVNRCLEERVINAELFTLGARAAGATDAAYVPWVVAPHSIIGPPLIGLRAVDWRMPISEVPLTVRLFQLWVLMIGRMAGVNLPRPTSMPSAATDRTLAWIVGLIRAHGRVCLNTTVSIAARLSELATRQGCALNGLWWHVLGEPLTPARIDTICASGARVFANYSMTETGMIGMSCGDVSDLDDFHVCTDIVAVSAPGPNRWRPERAPDSLLLTTIVATMPKVMLNAEIGDGAVLERRGCGCCLGEVGLTTHVSTVRGIDKLTGQGVTLYGADLAAFVDADLPARFGGSIGDFQLHEGESPDGRVSLTLRIDPRVGAIDEVAAGRALFDWLGRQSIVGQHMARVLQAADAVRVERLPPITTASGKTPHFVPLRAKTDRQGRT